MKRSPELCCVFQVETLETILGPPRNGSAFYKEPDSRAGKDMGSKQANMPDSLHGNTCAFNGNSPQSRTRLLSLQACMG